MSQGYNPYFDATNRPLGKTPVRFSRTEIQHIAIAVAALTLAMLFYLSRQDTIAGRIDAIFTQPVTLVAAFLAVSSGFVLHELAHKFTAVKYGCVAEFRAQMGGLAFAVIFALVTGFIFAAPGAVQIYGRVDQRENGLISLAGPATNLAIALVCLPLIISLTGVASEIFFIVGVVNAVLAAFNLLPFGPLDGRKVMAWSKGAWGAAMLGAIVFIAASLFASNLTL